MAPWGSGTGSAYPVPWAQVLLEQALAYPGGAETHLLDVLSSSAAGSTPASPAVVRAPRHRIKWTVEAGEGGASRELCPPPGEDGHISGAGVGYSREHLPEIRRALRGKHGLCQAGLKELLQKELPTWTPMGLREGDYSAFMSVLDTDKDCKVDFVEYVCSLACLCTFCHDYFKDVTPVTPCSQ
ncbi:protein S100-A3 isoform X2 [Prionailurus viverrinus]|uniref:protein S100-A3 isoform X2 n=1 Tax=Prionailurus viverrinus TaxID=61388 RepID=UPI001FF45F38|nr:protein S100-A3 isoform X2 [Prionailurus viverrinus]